MRRAPAERQPTRLLPRLRHGPDAAPSRLSVSLGRRPLSHLWKPWVVGEGRSLFLGMQGRDQPRDSKHTLHVLQRPRTRLTTPNHTPTPTLYPTRTLGARPNRGRDSALEPLLHLQVVELAALGTGHQPRPRHRDALQRAGRVEGAAALPEPQRRAVALGDRAARRRRVERRAVAPALLDELQAACEGRWRSVGRASWARGGRPRLWGLRFIGVVSASTPASQTLMPELNPETILPPSLSNATLRTLEPASVDPISFMVAVSKGKGKNGQICARICDFGPNRACIPDFDRLVV